MNKTIVCILLVLTCYFFNEASGQSYSINRQYSKNDGLPSNTIYVLFQDSKGFLWIGTDNGVSRFDGKFFKNYGSKEGLLDSEIFDINEEADGTIWVTSYSSVGPMYLDKNTNTFKQPEGYKMQGEGVQYLYPLKNEGMLIINTGAFSLRLYRSNKKNIWLEASDAYINQQAILSDKPVKILLGISDPFTSKSFKDYNILARILSSYMPKDSSGYQFFIDHKVLYYTKQPGRIGVDSISYYKAIKLASVNNDKMVLYTSDKELIVFDKASKQLINRLLLGNSCTVLKIDRDGNVWCALFGIGLVVVKPNNMHVFPTGKFTIDQRFRSVYVDDLDKVYAGNYFGEVFTSENNGAVHALSLLSQNTRWIKGLYKSQNKIFTFSDPDGIHINYQRKFQTDNSSLSEPDNRRVKAARQINDSIILIGAVRDQGSLSKINTISEKVTLLHSNVNWISSLSELYNGVVYYGSNSGLYKYNYNTNSSADVFHNTALRKERIIAVTTGKTGMTMVATIKSGLFFTREDKIIRAIGYDSLFYSLPQCIVAAEDASVWIGTNKGLVRVFYTLQNNQIVNYRILNYAVLGGMFASSINAIYLKNYKLYVATDDGVGYFDTNAVTLPSVDIKPLLSEIKINKNVVPLQDSFILKAYQNIIDLEFAGVDINGGLRKLQYRFGKHGPWQDIAGNKLNLVLTSGIAFLQVKAVHENGMANSSVLQIYFDLVPPIYGRAWFVVLSTALGATAIFFFFHKIKKNRRDRLLKSKAKIESERNRITADLHDEIGASLSSLQIYSDVVLKIMDKDSEKSRAIMTKLSSQAYQMSGKINDIIWSLKPVNETSMNMTNRIRTMVSEMLGELDFKYSVYIDEVIDAKMQNVIFRKNVILIIKEAINNSIKYGKAKNVNVTLSMVGTHCLLSVSDDGIGMVINEKKGQGNGLGNITMRAKEMNGVAIIESEPGKGVSIKVEIPVSNIFE